jgi:hypothetical protein
VVELNEVGLSTREIGEVVNSGHATIARDLKELAQNAKFGILNQSDRDNQECPEDEEPTEQETKCQPNASLEGLNQIIKEGIAQESLEKMGKKHCVKIPLEQREKVIAEVKAKRYEVISCFPASQVL